MIDVKVKAQPLTSGRSAPLGQGYQISPERDKVED
jgi:hypothetical protein